MTEATEVLSGSRPSHLRIVGAVSAAHFVSHYYILLLAPLLPFVRADYGVSYTEIGLALSAFNIVSTVFQTPVGFLVDWLGARILLIGGLLIGAGAFAVAGLVDSFWVLVAMFGLAGVGNAVYHPADYALLSQHVPAQNIGRAFSVHTFAGMLGSALAPPTLLTMQNLWGWRVAFVGAAIIGLAAAALVAFIRDNGAPVHPAPAPARAAKQADAGGWRLLMAPAILLNLMFFMLLAMISGGIYNYSVVAFGALYGTPVGTANGALTGNLLFSSIGVLIGGWLVGRTSRHAAVAGLGLALMALLTVLVGVIELAPLVLIGAMSLSGFFSGVIMPSRDMIVREVTPPGAFGRVFGFVTTGFNLGGIVSPLVFGAIMDHGRPQLVFLAAAGFALLAILTVATRPRPRL